LRCAEAEGYDVIKPVGTGENAIRMAMKHRPDVIFMDIRLAGEMDAYRPRGRLIVSTPAFYFYDRLPIDGARDQTVTLSRRPSLTNPRFEEAEINTGPRRV